MQAYLPLWEKKEELKEFMKKAKAGLPQHRRELEKGHSEVFLHLMFFSLKKDPMDNHRTHRQIEKLRNRHMKRSLQS
jgi:hypothetical protein